MPHLHSALLRRFLYITLFLLVLTSIGCNVQRGALQGSFLGSGFYRPHSAGVLSVLWRRHIDPNYKNKVLTWKMSPEESSTPAIDEDLEQVCVGSERQYFACFDSQTGKQKWFKKLQGRIAATPLIHGDVIYVGTTSGQMYALNRSNGELAWKKPYQADGEILSKATVVSFKSGDAFLIFTSSNNKVFALDAATGAWKWLHKGDAPNNLSIRGQAPAMHHNGVVYTGFSDGSIVAIKAKTGEKIWARSLKENERFPDVDAGLVIEDNVLYAASYSGSLHAMKLKTGKTIWKRKLSGATKPLVSDGHVFVTTSDGRIHKLDAETGKPLWKKVKKYNRAGTFTNLVADDYYIYASSSQYGLFVIHRDEGNLVQILRFGKQGFATPVIKDSHLFVLSFSSFLYSLSSKRKPNAQR